MPVSRSSTSKAARSTLNLGHSLDTKRDVYVTSYKQSFGGKKSSWSAGSTKYPVIPAIATHDADDGLFNRRSELSKAKSESSLASFGFDDRSQVSFTPASG